MFEFCFLASVDRLSELLIGANMNDTLSCDSNYEGNHTGAPVSSEYLCFKLII